MIPDYLPIALRVHTERLKRKKPRKSGDSGKCKSHSKWGSIVVLIDTETTTDTTQALNFGRARICRWRDNATLEVLRAYCSTPMTCRLATLKESRCFTSMLARTRRLVCGC